MGVTWKRSSSALGSLSAARGETVPYPSRGTVLVLSILLYAAGSQGVLEQGVL